MQIDSTVSGTAKLTINTEYSLNLTVDLRLFISIPVPLMICWPKVIERLPDDLLSNSYSSFCQKEYLPLFKRFHYVHLIIDIKNRFLRS